MQTFSLAEVRDLVISVVIITLVFAYPNVQFFPIYLLIILVSFVLHELAHKFVAQKFGAVAFYKMWVPGLFLGVLSMFLPFRFFAPGAVVIYQYRFAKWKKKRFGFGHSHRGNLTQEEMGLIAVSGPLVNFAIAAIAALFGGAFGGLLASLNALLAFFNMLPVRPLDGSKVMEWKPWLWIFLQVTAGALLFGTVRLF